MRLFNQTDNCSARMIVVLLLVLVTSACSQTEWCDSRAAKQLRERNVTTMEYATVEEFLAATPNDPIALFAHRGGFHCEEMDSAPENSIPNVEKAIRMGFDGLETDMWVSADGEFLIHHDETLDRTTTGSGPVMAITFEESRELRLKYPSGKVTEEKIPTYRELLVAGERRILYLIELKGAVPTRFPELVDIARELNSLDKVLFWIDWSAEYAELFEQYVASGLTEAKTNVLWRTRSLEAIDDVANRFDPLMVDIPPQPEELGAALGYKTYIFGMVPEHHLSLVRAAQNHGIKVLMSKVVTNAYMRELINEGIRAFMSRSPEVQLDYLIDKGWHR